MSAVYTSERFVGIDFGTTNSAIAVAETDGSVRVSTFDSGGVLTEVLRSVLFFEADPDARSGVIVTAGLAAIEASLAGNEGRLLQSIKSFLPSPSMDKTAIFGRVFSYEELVARFLKELRRQAEVTLGPLGRRAVVGRPVVFVKDGEDGREELALTRLRTAYAAAGFTEVDFQYEPVAAALEFARGRDDVSTVLVGDFGGGTSDFCVMRLGGHRREVISTSGVPVAGDTFDGRIVRAVVAPELGLGSYYQSFDKRLEVPSALYWNVERWHHLAFMRDRETLHVLRKIEASAEHPERLRTFIRLIQNNLGFALYRAVDRTKVALSVGSEAALDFVDDDVSIRRTVKRADFERWIGDDLLRIGAGIDDALSRAGLTEAQIDEVVLTGGSSFVPAVREVFTRRFGTERLRRAAEFTSIAHGLALDARARAVSEARG